MTMPNFLVIGAGRSGTTSLDRYLGGHPDIFMAPVKAPSHFFCADRERIDDPTLRLVTRNHFVPDPDEYEALFDDAGAAAAVGETSPVYLASRAVPDRIAERLGTDVRLIAIVRNPVERVWARWLGRHRDGLERRSFERMLAEERSEPLVRDEAFGTYLAAGIVSHYLEPYLERFGAERVRVHLYDDFARDTPAVLADLFTFLGLDPSVRVDTGARLNRSGGEIRAGVVRRAWRASALFRARTRRYVPRRVRDAAFARITSDLRPVELDPGLREQLTELYADEIERLGALLGRDLSPWLSGARVQG